MARCAVPARVIAGGTNIRATLAIEGLAPLHAARTSQRDVPTTQNKYRAGRPCHYLGSGVTAAISFALVLHFVIGEMPNRVTGSRFGIGTLPFFDRIIVQRAIVSLANRRKRKQIPQDLTAKARTDLLDQR